MRRVIAAKSVGNPRKMVRRDPKEPRKAKRRVRVREKKLMLRLGGVRVSLEGALDLIPKPKVRLVMKKVSKRLKPVMSRVLAAQGFAGNSCLK